MNGHLTMPSENSVRFGSMSALQAKRRSVGSSGDLVESGDRNLLIHESIRARRNSSSATDLKRPWKRHLSVR
jgi:hypothetical protein